MLNARIKTSVDNAMAQATSVDAQVGYVSLSINQLVTLGVGGSLYSIHQDLNMVDQNIRILQQTLTGLCNVVGTFDKNMHHLSQNGTAQLIRGNLTNWPRYDFELQLSTFTEELYSVRYLTEGGGFNTIMGDFKFFTDVTVWVQEKLASNTPNFEHFIDFDIFLARI